MPRLTTPIASLVALSVSGCSLFFPSQDPVGDHPDGGGTIQGTPTALTGCAATSPHMAPGGYYVNGNTVCTAAGRNHLFHGVDRPSLEWSPVGQNLSPADFQLMASWKANAVRIALNQDFWLSASPLYDPTYAARIDTNIGWAEDAGLDVILDLHWSDKGTFGSCKLADGCQQLMADPHSITFWSEVAGRYKNDGRVLFELYNEPHDVSWEIWKSGGMTNDGWKAAGMQQLHDAVRAAGADNLVVIGGLDWAYDLSGVPSHRIAGYNILYATHPYDGASERSPQHWNAGWAFLTATDAVIVTEFGDISGACSADYSSQLIKYADLKAASWTAWAWFPGGCSFPALIDDWTGAPTPTGVVVKAALVGYNDPSAGGARDAGAPVGDGGEPDGSTSDGGAPENDGSSQ